MNYKRELAQDIPASYALNLALQNPELKRENTIWKKKYLTYFAQNPQFQKMLADLEKTKDVVDFDLLSQFNRYKILIDPVRSPNINWYEEFETLYTSMPHVWNDKSGMTRRIEYYQRFPNVEKDGILWIDIANGKEISIRKNTVEYPIYFYNQNTKYRIDMNEITKTKDKNSVYFSIYDPKEVDRLNDSSLKYLLHTLGIGGVSLSALTAENYIENMLKSSATDILNMFKAIANPRYYSVKSVGRILNEFPTLLREYETGVYPLEEAQMQYNAIRELLRQLQFLITDIPQKILESNSFKYAGVTITASTILYLMYTVVDSLYYRYKTIPGKRYLSEITMNVDIGLRPDFHIFMSIDGVMKKVIRFRYYNNGASQTELAFWTHEVGTRDLLACGVCGSKNTTLMLDTGDVAFCSYRCGNIYIK